MSFRFAYLPLTVATLTFIAFGLGIFFRGLDQLLFAPALLCILLAAFILLIGGLRRGWSLPAGDSAVFLALFWAWLVIALSWSQVAQVSTVFTLLLGAMPLLFFSVLQHPRHGDISRWYSASLSLALGLLGVWALIQFFVLLDLAGTRIRHPMLNPNNLAVLLAMGFFMALAFFVRLQGWRMVLWGALACVLACALLTTQSRGGTLGFFTGIVLLAVFNRGFFVQNWRRMAVLFVSAAAGWIIILSVMSEKFEQVRVFGGEKAMASISERFMLFDSGIRMLLDRPIFGAGLGNFYFLFPSYRNFDDTSDGFFLHVDPLQFAIETGFPVLFIFYGFCLAVLLTTIKAIRKSDAGSQNRMMLMLPFAALVCLLINAHVNFDLYMLPALMLASACLIHWYAASEAILGPKRILVHKDRKLLHIPILLFILAAFVIAPVWLARDAASIYFSGKASVALHQGDMEDAKKNIDLAKQYGVPSHYRTYYVESQWYAQMLEKNAQALNFQEQKATFDFSMSALDLSLKYNPFYVYALNHKAYVYLLAYPAIAPDGLDKAEQILTESIALDPINFDARIGLARVLSKKGFPAKGLYVLEQGMQWRGARRFASIRYRNLMVELYHLLGRQDGIERMQAENAAYIRSMEYKMKTREGIDQWVDGKIKALLKQ